MFEITFLVVHRLYRPAGYETFFAAPRLLVLSWSVGNEVGFCLVRKSPFSSWTRGALMTPDCAKGRHRSWSMLFRVRDEVPTPTATRWRERWISCIRGVPVSTFIKRRWWRAPGLGRQSKPGGPDLRDHDVGPPGLAWLTEMGCTHVTLEAT